MLNSGVSTAALEKLAPTAIFRCVLDAYLYSPGKGKEPVVTHVDARTPAGTDVDHASCAATLQQR